MTLRELYVTLDACKLSEEDKDKPIVLIVNDGSGEYDGELQDVSAWPDHIEFSGS